MKRRLNTLLLVLFLLLLLGCVKVDMSSKINLTKTNTSYDYSQKSEINQPINLTSKNVTIQSDVSLTNSSLNTSLNQSTSSNLTNTTVFEVNKSEIKTSSNFEIFFPRGDYKAKGDLVAISLKLINFSIGNLGDVEKPNVGLFKYSVDNQDGFKISDKATFTVSNLSKGKRTLTIEMIGTNMTPLGVKKSISFEAQSVTEGY